MNYSNWHMSCSAVQGLSHKIKNIPCQDKVLTQLNNGVHCIALADGAGSAFLSEIGAENIVSCMSNYFTNNFDQIYSTNNDNLKVLIADIIKDKLLKLSKHCNCNIKDLSSTLLLVALKGQHYTAIHIGDGVIGCYVRDKLTVLSAPENGEYANLTWFTTTKNLESVIRIYKGNVSTISGFLVMSDGVENSLYDKDNNSLTDGCINLLFYNAKTSNKLMISLLTEALENVISKRTKDDCSIAVLSRSRFKNFKEYSKYRKKFIKRKNKDKRKVENGF